MRSQEQAKAVAVYVGSKDCGKPTLHNPSRSNPESEATGALIVTPVGYSDGEAGHCQWPES